MKILINKTIKVMKKIYSTMMMLAMMVAALSFIACGGDDDEIDNGGEKGQKTIKINGESFYCGSSSNVEQTKGNGMYLNIYAVTDMNFQMKGHKLIIVLSPSRVSQLNEGEEFYYDEMSVRTLVHLNEIQINTYDWKAISGSLTFKSIGNYELKVQFNNLVVKHRNTNVERTIEGTAILNSGVYGYDGKLLPFSEAIGSLPDWLEDDY